MDDEWEREDWEEGISRGGQVRRFDAWMKDQVERVYICIYKRVGGCHDWRKKVGSRNWRAIELTGVKRTGRGIEARLFFSFFFFFFSFDFKSPIPREEEEAELTRNGVESGVMTLLGQITGDPVAFDHFIKFSGFKGVASRFGIHPFINPAPGISFNCSL